MKTLMIMNDTIDDNNDIFYSSFPKYKITERWFPLRIIQQTSITTVTCYCYFPFLPPFSSSSFEYDHFCLIKATPTRVVSVKYICTYFL